jgi:chromosome segregation ATPase
MKIELPSDAVQKAAAQNLVDLLVSGFVNQVTPPVRRLEAEANAAELKITEMGESLTKRTRELRQVEETLEQCRGALTEVDAQVAAARAELAKVEAACADARVKLQKLSAAMVATEVAHSHN